MAFPTVVQVVKSSTNTAGTSHTVNLPTAAAGHLLLIILDKGSTAATINAHASLTELLDENNANGLYIAYRWMDGSEPSSYTLTSSANTRSAVLAYLISFARDPASQPPVIGTTATGTSATPDPPASATPSATDDYLFIAFAGMAGEEADDDTWGNTPPTNYTPSPPRQKSCGVAGTNLGGLILAAERQLNTGASQNPGTFGVDVSAAWRAQTILIYPAVPLLVDDNDEQHVQRQTQVARGRAAAAALSLTAAIGLGLANSPQDEIAAPAPPESRGESESVRFVPMGAEPLPFAFWSDDEIVPQPAASALEEGEWLATWAQPYRLPSVFIADEDIVPQAPEAALDDDGWVAAWVQPYRVVPAAVSVEDEFAPQPAEAALDDGGWVAAWAQPYRVSVASFVDEEIVPQPGEFIPEEDYWLQLGAERAEVFITGVDWISGAGSAAPAVALGVDEDYWRAFWPALPQPVVRFFWFNDEITEPIPPSDGATAGAFTGRAIVAPVYWKWLQVDELPLALGVDESDWNVYTPPPARPQALYLPDSEEAWPTPPSPLGVDEDWFAPRPPLPQPTVTYFWFNDEWVTPPAPLEVDELYWNVFTPATPIPVIAVWQTPDESMEWAAPAPPKKEEPFGRHKGRRWGIEFKPNKKEVPSGNDDAQVMELIRRFLERADDGE